MTGKILEEILAAEKKAADIREEAEKKADGIVKEAAANGEKLCAFAHTLGEKKLSDVRKEVAALTENAIGEAENKARDDARISCAAASANVGDAVRLIIGRAGSQWQ